MSTELETFWAVLREFGPGSLTVLTGEGLRSRPVIPVVDIARQEITCLADEGWLRGVAGGQLDASMSFINEYRRSALAIEGSVRVSLHEHDIRAAWATMAGHWFPDGPTQPGIAAIRMTPVRADYWDLARICERASWMFGRGEVVRFGSIN